MAQVNYPSETERSALLNAYMYFDYTGAKDGDSLAKIVEKLEVESKQWTADSSKMNQLHIMQSALKNNPEFGEIHIGMQKNKDGISAAVFMDGDQYYVAYRGTGEGKWIDNGEGMVDVITPSQQSASDFFDEAGDRYHWDENTRLIVTGHSKGGNEAQVSVLNSKYGQYVDKCISFDGQGMSEAAINHYKEILGDEYEERLDKMYSVCNENDPVHELGIKIIKDDHTFYIETNTNTARDNVYSMHAIEYLFYKGTDENGNPIYEATLNDETQQGSIARYAEELSKALMELPEAERRGCSVAIMQFIEIINGEDWEGFNGHTASLEDWDDLLFKGLPVIIKSIVATEEGREAASYLINDVLAEFLKEMVENKDWKTAITISAVLSVTPMLFPWICVVAGDVVVAIHALREMKDAIARIIELGENLSAFVDKCIEKAAKFAEDVKNWVREHINGATVFTEAHFSVNTNMLYQAAEDLRGVQQKFNHAREELDRLRNSLPYFSSGGLAIQVKLASMAINLWQEANAAGQMAILTDRAGQCYQRYEAGIAAYAPC